MSILLGRDGSCPWNSFLVLASAIAFSAAIAILSNLPEARAQSALLPVSQSSRSIPETQEGAYLKMEFEVASIHPAVPGARVHSNMDLSVDDLAVDTGGRFKATGALGTFIQFAYKLKKFQDQAAFDRLPKWATSEMFDIEAKAPTANPTKEQMRLMMQSLLAERFKLAVHFKTQVVPVMALVLVKPGKLGSRLRLHSEGPACDAKIPPVNRNSAEIPDVWMPTCGSTQLLDWANHTVILGSRDTTMDTWVQWLPLLEQIDRPVVNRTGLTGRFDIELNFTPYWVLPKEQSTDAQLEFSGPTFFEALNNQLGLKLLSTRAPVQTIVIDYVEQPSPN